MKLQSFFRRKEKLTNHLVINAHAHMGALLSPAGTAHRAALTAAVRAGPTDELLQSKNSSQRVFGLCCSNIWSALTRLLPCRAGTAQTACN